MKVYVTTSDNYLDLIKIFQFLFNRFWGKDQEVVVLGYKKPEFELEENFSFHSMGVSRHTPDEWSTDLKKYFESINDKHFILFFEDNFVVRPVNHELLNEIKDCLNDSVGRFCINNSIERSRGYVGTTKHIGYLKNVPLLECNQDSQYRISGMPSIWQRKYFLDNIQEEWSPWKWEIHGSELIKHDGFKILGTAIEHVVYNTLSVRKGDLTNIDWRIVDDYSKSLDENIINEMKELNIL
jgi:hypothetical protein